MNQETAPVSAPKRRFPRAAGLDVARELCDALRPVTSRLIVAGSLRRRKEQVGDVEILFIPSWGRVIEPGDLFPKTGNMADAAIRDLIHRGILAPRLSKDGKKALGPKNKLTVHCASGIPVDLFTSTPVNWFNYLVCRTGGKDSNTLIATRAREQGYRWNPYDSGFTRLSDFCEIPMASERQVFEHVGLKYLEPWERP